MAFCFLELGAATLVSTNRPYTKLGLRFPDINLIATLC